MPSSDRYESKSSEYTLVTRFPALGSGFLSGLFGSESSQYSPQSGWPPPPSSASSGGLNDPVGTGNLGLLGNLGNAARGGGFPNASPMGGGFPSSAAMGASPMGMAPPPGGIPPPFGAAPTGMNSFGGMPSGFNSVPMGGGLSGFPGGMPNGAGAMTPMGMGMGMGPGLGASPMSSGMPLAALPNGGMDPMGGTSRMDPWGADPEAGTGTGGLGKLGGLIGKLGRRRRK